MLKKQNLCLILPLLISLLRIIEPPDVSKTIFSHKHFTVFEDVENLGFIGLLHPSTQGSKTLLQLPQVQSQKIYLAEQISLRIFKSPHLICIQ